MIVKVVDFEILSRHYVKYQEGVTEIDKVKKDFIKRLDPFRKKMQELMISTNSDINEEAQKIRNERFQELQEQGMAIDEEFKSTMRKMNDELSKVIYSDLENIISEWSIKNSIDMVIGSTEVVFLNQKHNITDDIINILKEKDLFIDFIKGNVVSPVK